jgi:hypothetical protein
MSKDGVSRRVFSKEFKDDREIGEEELLRGI